MRKFLFVLLVARTVVQDLIWRNSHLLVMDLNHINLNDEEVLIRITGCPNGCARPYMAELAFVGDGPKSYQIWLGGSPVLTRTAYPYKAKMKQDDMEATLEPVLAFFVEKRQEFEAFGDFCHRVGAEAIEAYASTYTLKA